VREDLLFDVFKVYSPDILGLQEVTKGWYDGKLLSRLADEYAFVGTELADNNNYVPFVYKKSLKLMAKGFEYLEHTPDSSKAITWAVLAREDGGVFAVCNTHFWWRSGPEHDEIRVLNAKQLATLMESLRARYRCPVFAFGDMNTNVKSACFTEYKHRNIRHLLDVAEKKDVVCSHHGDPVLGEDGRYHGRKTDKDFTRSIDHIVALGDEFTVSEYRVIEDQNALDATDHSPVYADVAFR
jgi:endonuclease/exonuclease/phosphatase family metal-dependent hydrolase